MDLLNTLGGQPLTWVSEPNRACICVLVVQICLFKANDWIFIFLVSMDWENQWRQWKRKWRSWILRYRLGHISQLHRNFNHSGIDLHLFPIPGNKSYSVRQGFRQNLSKKSKIINFSHFWPFLQPVVFWDFFWRHLFKHEVFPKRLFSNGTLFRCWPYLTWPDLTWPDLT